MSQWDERFTGHGVWASLQAFGEKVDECISRFEDNQEMIWGLERLKTILEFVGKRLESTDPILVPATPLDFTLHQFNAAHSQLVEMLRDGAIGHIHSANNQLDEALIHLGQLPVFITSDHIEPLKDACNRYRQLMETCADDAVKRVDVLTGNAKTVDTNFEAFKAQTADQLAGLRQEIAEERSRLVQIVSNYQDQFSNAQDARQTTFNTALRDFTTQLDERRTVFENDSRALMDRYRDEAEQYLVVLLSQQNKAQELVGLIGNLGMTSGFQKAATQAWKSAVSWQKYTTWAICGLIIWLLVSFGFGFATSGLTWPDIAGRVLVSLAFGALAAYCGFQGDKYLRIHRINSKLELELAAVGPYLAPLEKEDQNIFLMELAKKIFGQDDVLMDAMRGRSPTNVLDLLASKQMLRLAKVLEEPLKNASPEIVKMLTELAKSTASRPDAGSDTVSK